MLRRSFEISVEQSDTPVLGFKTAQGSIYRYCADTHISQRYKVSHGTGQGELARETVCFFLSPEQQEHLNEKYLYITGNYVYSFGRSKEGQKNRAVAFLSNEIELKPDEQVTLNIYDKRAQTHVFCKPIKFLLPETGLVPIEISMSEGAGSRQGLETHMHIGNPIVKLYTSEADFAAALEAAKDQFSSPSL